MPRQNPWISSKPTKQELTDIDEAVFEILFNLEDPFSSEHSKKVLTIEAIEKLAQTNSKWSAITEEYQSKSNNKFNPVYEKVMSLLTKKSALRQRIAAEKEARDMAADCPREESASLDIPEESEEQPLVFIDTSKPAAETEAPEQEAEEEPQPSNSGEEMTRAPDKPTPQVKDDIDCTDEVWMAL